MGTVDSLTGANEREAAMKEAEAEQARLEEEQRRQEEELRLAEEQAEQQKIRGLQSTRRSPGAGGSTLG